VEWAAQTEQTDLPELASPQLFYPMNRHPAADAPRQGSNQHG
jgi:NNP family nitrate/nitrite transporter-like MFS transporter